MYLHGNWPSTNARSVWMKNSTAQHCARGKLNIDIMTLYMLIISRVTLKMKAKLKMSTAISHQAVWSWRTIGPAICVARARCVMLTLRHPSTTVEAWTVLASAEMHLHTAVSDESKPDNSLLLQFSMPSLTAWCTILHAPNTESILPHHPSLLVSKWPHIMKQYPAVPLIVLWCRDEVNERQSVIYDS